MTLSCSCDTIDQLKPGAASWYYCGPKDFETLQTNRAKRCCSCKKKIAVGDICTSFSRWRDTRTDIEESIHGDEVYMAAWYMCEWCSEMYFNLEALGYCHWLGDSIVETMQEYWEMTGFIPDKATASRDNPLN